MAATYGVFFAVLPVQPTISTNQLRDACQCVAKDHGDFVLKWTHHRNASLVHPALSDPLGFLEISGKLDIIDKENVQTIEQVCDRIVQLLETQAAVIGKAELLLVLQDTPIPLLPTELPMNANAETFRQYGLVGIKDAINISHVDELYELAVSTFEKLYALLQTKPKQHYKEIMRRDNNRFDFRMDLASGDDQWKKFEAAGKWKPLVKELLGENCSLVKCGCVLSLPGAGMQYYHSDGVHVGASASFDLEEAAPTHALCVFVPLIDLNRSVGYTEFWAGSHKYSKLLDKKGEQALPGGTDGILTKGDCLLYDYRTIHRGTPNASDVTRPVCYFLYSRKGMEGVEDQNFRSDSIFE
ncbi:hypothetical protein MPSEU_000267400 [Mayamaea pseudoterrestris]|nr:hypothetical protein MPSEU_000267400 [Mayamaea pseudoterrestris]